MKIDKEKVKNLCEIVNDEGAYILIVNKHIKLSLNRMLVIDDNLLLAYQFTGMPGVRFSVLIHLQEIDNEVKVVHYDCNTEKEPVTLLSQVVADDDEYTKTIAKVGDKVKYIGIKHDYAPEYFPEPGTIGTVTRVDVETYTVQWPKGSTSGDDRWIVQHNNVVCIP